MANDPNVLTAAGKRLLIAEYHARYPSAVIETGIWQGQGSTFTLDAKITAIEVNPESCERARREHPHVWVIEGDSGEWIPRLLSLRCDSVLFWLDAHLVSEADEPNHSPLLAELAGILKLLG